MSYLLNGGVVAVRRKKSTSRIPEYRGVESTLWWPLHQHAERDGRARELTEALRMRWLTQPVEWVRPHASDDLDFLRSYVARCDDLQIGSLCAVVCGSPEAPDPPPPWLTALRAACEYMGIDITYPDGSYSFVDDDFVPANAEIFEFLKHHLNDRGLFDGAGDAVEFMRLHQAANDRGANLETLEGVTAVELWEDADLSKLRAILKQY